MNQDTVHAFLEAHPLARERRQKNRAIARLLQSRYAFLEGIPDETLVDMIVDAANLDRYWRQTLEQNPHLRGTDYDTKKKVVQEKQQALGYEAGYYQDIKSPVA